MIITTENTLARLFEIGLSLSNFNSSKSIAILKKINSNPDEVNAIVDTLISIGAKFYLIDVDDDNNYKVCRNPLLREGASNNLNERSSGVEIIEKVDLVFEAF
ncbi:hypothetical protein LLQ46_12460 [Rouxiella badensis]|jgi:hypothetical protein|uniref:hypothetical protein n=1 Tax=Rouxiella badensis TaxID=1646377 RepID=UPI0017884DE3|nr:hypothetical protein [Rouxiella badensis]MCC3703051.1 hypothetical protein [Rouxiella badensis]MCC3747658.1 hypothetical protein [Rouxiella badensis]QOI55938.1 hypothetical protein H2866_01875 [Rouxiella badensis subsp. acadiensis]